MIDQHQFQQCLAEAKRLVASYRAQAPEGCDPQNTWFAVGYLVVSDISKRAQSGKWFGFEGGVFDTKAQADASFQNGGSGGAFGTLAVPKPAEIEYASPGEILSNWRGEVLGKFPEYSKIAGKLNEDEQAAAQRANQLANPQYYGLLAGLTNKAMDFTSGKLPADVKKNILTQANEQSYLKGFSYGTDSGKGGNVYAGGNDAAANLALKNLGLTSLDLTKLGLDISQTALAESRASRGQIMSAKDTIPTQGFFADQMNKQSEGAYMNEQNKNNYKAGVANAPQQAAYNQMLFRSNMLSNNQQVQAQQTQQYAQIAGQAVQAYSNYRQDSGGQGGSFSGGQQGSGYYPPSQDASYGGSSARTAGSWQPTTGTTQYIAAT